jgi:23S rRNA pseudouridine955/2504/2580 synthase
MKEGIDFITSEDDADKRLDRVLRRLFPTLPLSAVYKALRKGRVLLNGERAQASDRIVAGAVIRVASRIGNPNIMAASTMCSAKESELVGKSRENLDKMLIIDTKNLIFLNKPSGMLVHGESGLDEIVRYALAERAVPSLSFTMGPLHRLDRNTSGLVCFSATSFGGRVFSELLREGKLEKRYIALVEGSLNEEELWMDVLARDSRIMKTLIVTEGSNLQHEMTATTRAYPLLHAAGFTLAMFQIATGRTHQIRAQAAHHGHPLSCDRKYGGIGEGTYLLHAWTIDFETPPFPDVPLRIEAPLPKEARQHLYSVFGAEEIESSLDAVRRSSPS